MIRTYFLEFYIMTDSLPDWTGVVQAFAAVLATIFAIITVWKLVARDKKRESEIESLSVIAAELKNMMVHNQQIFTESKKPNIKVSVNNGVDGHTLEFLNSNLNAQITSYELPDKRYVGRGRSADILIISEKQYFFFAIKDIPKDVPFSELEVIYIVDKIYIFSQKLYIAWDKEELFATPRNVYYLGMKNPEEIESA